MLQFPQMTQDQINHIVPGQAAIAQALQGDDIESVSTTAAVLSLTAFTSYLVISGTMTGTLPNGAFPGQRKRVEVLSVASTPAYTLTVTTPESATGLVCAGSFFFDTVGQAIDFLWTGTKWRATRVQRAGGVVDNVVIQTTVLTGKNMWLRYNCSVDGTKTSTTTMALPNGSAPGEQCWITNTTATNTPIGTLDGVYTAGLVTAYTHAGTIGVVASATAVGDGALLTWTGAAWDVVYQSGITFS